MSSGAGSGFRTQQIGNIGLFDSRRNDSGELVRIASNMDKEEVSTGRIRLTQFTTEDPQSINLLVDSNDRVNGTPFDFTVNMQSNLFRARLAEVVKVVIPKTNNITPLNNIVEWRFEETLGLNYPLLKVTLTPGFYDVISLANELTTKMMAATVAAYPLINTPTFVCTFDNAANKFTLSYSIFDGLAFVSSNFYFLSSCNFITRGINLALFPSFADAGVGSTPVGMGFSYTSGNAGMVYTRFVTLHSSALTQFSYGETRTSTQVIGNSIVAIIGVTGILIDATRFAGTFATPNLDGAPNISVLNPQRQLQKFLDFSMQDEYGFPLTAIFSEDNQLGVSFWLKVSF